MSTPSSDRASSDRDRLLDILAIRATEGLSTEELKELHDLFELHPDVQPEEFESAAAWLDAAHFDTVEEPEPLPRHLRTQIEAQGRLCVRGARSAGAGMPVPRRGAPPEPTAAAEPSAPTAVSASIGDGAPSRTGGGLGWLSLAAGVLLGVTIGFALLGEKDLSPADALDRLVAQSSTNSLQRAPWEGVAGNGLETIQGEVIWSDARQEGYLTLEGLPPTQDTDQQYQLWIVDADRGHAEPVDGGVFDVSGDSGVQTIAIDAALVVERPGLFVITREVRGGVVVSQSDHLAYAKTP